MCTFAKGIVGLIQELGLSSALPRRRSVVCGVHATVFEKDGNMINLKRGWRFVWFPSSPRSQFEFTTTPLPFQGGFGTIDFSRQKISSFRTKENQRVKLCKNLSHDYYCLLDIVSIWRV